LSGGEMFLQPLVGRRETVKWANSYTFVQSQNRLSIPFAEAKIRGLANLHQDCSPTVSPGKCLEPGE